MISDSEELDNLSDDLSILFLNTVNMTTNQNQSVINVPLLRYQADNIPPFDGNPKQLNRFINACENFIRAFQNPTVPQDPINICLFDTILSKLRDRAADLICSRSELNSWQLIKDALNLTFSDQRSIDCLIQDLITLKPAKNESPLQFGMRIQDARSLLFSKLDTTIADASEKRIKTAHYNDFALKTFINGLPYNMQLVVRLREPDSLEKALAYVKEEENFIYFKTGQNSNLHGSPYKSQPRINQNFQRPMTNNFRPHQNQVPLPNNFANYTRFTPNITRPNFMPRMQISQNFPNQFQQFRNTNQPVQTDSRPNWQSFNRLPAKQHPYFANQRNSAILRNQSFANKNIQKQNTPEAMDTSSSNSRIKQKPNFMSQELFAQQVENNAEPNLFTSNFENTYYNDENPNSQNFELIPDLDEYTQATDFYTNNHENFDETACFQNEPNYDQYENNYELEGNFPQATNAQNLT